MRVRTAATVSSATRQPRIQSGEVSPPGLQLTALPLSRVDPRPTLAPRRPKLGTPDTGTANRRRTFFRWPRGGRSKPIPRGPESAHRIGKFDGSQSDGVAARVVGRQQPGDAVRSRLLSAPEASATNRRPGVV